MIRKSLWKPLWRFSSPSCSFISLTGAVLFLKWCLWSKCAAIHLFPFQANSQYAGTKPRAFNELKQKSWEPKWMAVCWFLACWWVREKRRAVWSAPWPVEAWTNHGISPWFITFGVMSKDYTEILGELLALSLFVGKRDQSFWLTKFPNKISEEKGQGERETHTQIPKRLSVKRGSHVHIFWINRSAGIKQLGQGDCVLEDTG